MFQLVFPQPEMLSKDDLGSMMKAVMQPDISKVALRDKAESIRATLNPHPAGQKEENVPLLNGQNVLGTQHKYRETILFFPTEVSERCSEVFSKRDLTLNRANSAIRSALTASAGHNSLPWDQISNSHLRK